MILPRVSARGARALIERWRFFCHFSRMIIRRQRRRRLWELLPRRGQYRRGFAGEAGRSRGSDSGGLRRGYFLPSVVISWAMEPIAGAMKIGF
jgi:hypothetical protein